MNLSLSLTVLTSPTRGITLRVGPLWRPLQHGRVRMDRNASDLVEGGRCDHQGAFAYATVTHTLILSARSEQIRGHLSILFLTLVFDPGYIFHPLILCLLSLSALTLSRYLHISLSLTFLPSLSLFPSLLTLCLFRSTGRRQGRVSRHPRGGPQGNGQSRRQHPARASRPGTVLPLFFAALIHALRWQLSKREISFHAI
jgi:hypothetical protein